MRKYFWLMIALPLAAYIVLPLPGQSASLPERIEEKRDRVAGKKRVEGVLSTTIQRYGLRIDSLQGEINGTEQRLAGVQDDLDAERAELLRLRDELEAARDRLERARAQLARARRALADRLVELYKSDQPDVLTVVLESDGFDDLLERTEFLERISDQDRAVVVRVRVLKARYESRERRLDELEDEKQASAARILQQRDGIAATRDRLASAQGQLRDQRYGRRRVLVKVREQRRGAQESLAALEREQERVTAKLRAAAPSAPSAANTPAGPIRQGSGSLIWPIDGPITSPFGPRWGRLHAGLDISAAGGTPIRAADSGRVVIAGLEGGYGNYTCIQHTSSLSTCYAHQSRLGTTAGASVQQGQVMGYVGNTGNSFGNHLHFEVRVNGSPVDPLGYL